jgi:hypothetical protein
VQPLPQLFCGPGTLQILPHRKPARVSRSTRTFRILLRATYLNRRIRISVENARIYDDNY